MLFFLPLMEFNLNCHREMKYETKFCVSPDAWMTRNAFGAEVYLTDSME